MKHVKPIKHLIIGVDEAGRGAWAGPVVAACVMWRGLSPLKHILRDSKKMTPNDRETTYAEILQLEKVGKLQFGIGVISHDIVDQVGIREANRRAMREALAQVQNAKCKMQNGGFVSVIPGEGVQACGTSEDPESRRITTRSDSYFEDKDCIFHLDSGSSVSLTSSMETSVWNDGKVRILIDGRDNYTFDIPGLPEPEYIVRGDSKIKQIMAASILAKVTRDMIMIDSENTFPGYGFERHKGYGTKVHQDALKKLGICDIHRRSYRPIVAFNLAKTSCKDRVSRPLS